MKTNKKIQVPESALIMADIEGIAGVYDKQQCKPGTPAWVEARGLITADVNSAIKGLREAGVSNIAVKDMHGPGFNVDIRKLESDVPCFRGHFWKPVPLMGVVPAADCAVMIGWHAGPDQQDGFSPHIVHKALRSLKINGKLVTEVELFSAVLGEHGIPAVFLTADKVTTERVVMNMPWIKLLEIPKQALSDKELEHIREQIRLHTMDSVMNIDEAKPLVFGSHTVELETLKKTVTWESESAVETLGRVLSESVFKNFPTVILPQLLAIYRLWSRINMKKYE
ncbi:MAG: M55 family metallopeptidase [Desulfobacterales bacterium]|nr:M55 family metallopeptidase [Desulfobacterales bacterium]